MKKWRMLKKWQIFKKVALTAAVIGSLYFIYNRYEDYRLTPRMSEAARQAPFKIDTTKLMKYKKEGIPYRLPKNIDELVGVYKGSSEDSYDYQIRVNKDGTYEAIGREKEVIKRYYITALGELQVKKARNFSFETGVVVENKGQILMEETTPLLVNLYSPYGVYLNEDGSDNPMKSFLNTFRRYYFYLEDPEVQLDRLYLDEWDNHDLALSPHYNRFDSLRSYDIIENGVMNFNGVELEKSTDVYEIWDKPIEEWGIEEFVTSEPTLNDFVQAFGDDIGNYGVDRARLVRTPSGGIDIIDDIEEYVSGQVRELTEKEKYFLKHEYGKEFTVAYIVEMTKGGQTDMLCKGWSEELGYQELFLSGYGIENYVPTDRR